MTRILRSAKSTEPSGWRSMPNTQPRNCFVCGLPIRISRQSCGFKTMRPYRSWHVACAKGPA